MEDILNFDDLYSDMVLEVRHCARQESSDMLVKLKQSKIGVTLFDKFGRRVEGLISIIEGHYDGKYVLCGYVSNEEEIAILKKEEHEELLSTNVRRLKVGDEVVFVASEDVIPQGKRGKFVDYNVDEIDSDFVA